MAGGDPNKMRNAFLFFSLALALPAATIERDAAGVTMRNAGETVRVAVCGPSVLHVVAGPGNPRAASPQEPWLVQTCKPAQFQFSRDEKKATLCTAALRVVFDLDKNLVTFQDAAGKTLIAESDREPRRYDRVEE
jgi:alpha-D-xyloside xylohydrolase